MASIKNLFDKSMKPHGDSPAGGGAVSPFGLRPFQILPRKEKDKAWAARNIDWLEWQGLLQLHALSKKNLKNYKLAAGILDKLDYIIQPEKTEDNEFDMLINTILKDEQEEAFKLNNLKFYPLLPVVINVLTDEFTKRESDIVYRAIDSWSANEILKEKEDKIREKVIEWLNKLAQEMMQSGQIPQEKAQEYQQQIMQQLMQELPNIDNHFKRNYRLNIERLASKIHEYDKLRFKLDEICYNAFKDFLITGSFFIELNMYEDDYEPVLWNPLFTFFRKKVGDPFISNGDWVGKIELMTFSEVIQKYGKYIGKEKLEKMQNKFKNLTGVIRSDRDPFTGDYWETGVDKPGETDVSKTGGIDYQRYIYWNGPLQYTEDIINKLFLSSADAVGVWYNDLLRVTKVYWKSIKTVKLLTKVDPFTKEKITTIVDEDYKPLLKPIYDVRFGEQKNANSLIAGEHIEEFLVEEVWGGIKIGPNFPTFYKDEYELFPVYIGINSEEPGPIQYSFNNSMDIYNCKLPVEGIIYSERNTLPVSLVDLAKPYQILYNIVNNQIADLLLDELGSFMILDANVLKKTNMEEDGGINPLMQAYNTIKKYKILDVDSSLANTGTPLSYNTFQQMMIENSPRIKTRIELANYFQMKMYETLGLTPERMGRPTGEYQSGKATMLNVINSYSTTEKYFQMFGDMFLPRFHEMRNSLFLFYMGTNKLKNKSISYITDNYERELIDNLTAEDALLRTFGVYETNKTSYKLVIDQIKQMIFNNPNLGLTLSDAIEVLSSESHGDIVSLVKKLEERNMQQMQMQNEGAMKQKEMEHKQKIEEIMVYGQIQNQLLDKKLLVEKEKIKAGILETSIASARYLASQDLDQNNKSDYLDYLQEIQESGNNWDKVYDKYIAISQNMEQKNKLLDYKNKELELRNRLKQVDLEIAKTYTSKENVKK